MYLKTKKGLISQIVAPMACTDCGNICSSGCGNECFDLCYTNCFFGCTGAKYDPM